MSESITKELLEQFEKKCSADAACQVAKNAVTENGLKASAKNGEAQRTTRPTLIFVSIVTSFLVLYCNKIRPIIHIDCQWNKIERWQIYGFKGRLHFDLGILRHSYGSLFRYNLKTRHTIYTIPGGPA